jgi:hypothetical protein
MAYVGYYTLTTLRSVSDITTFRYLALLHSSDDSLFIYSQICPYTFTASIRVDDLNGPRIILNITLVS